MRKRRLFLAAVALALTLLYFAQQHDHASTAKAALHAPPAASSTVQGGVLATGQPLAQMFSGPQTPTYPTTPPAPIGAGHVPTHDNNVITLKVMAPDTVRLGETFTISIDAETSAPVKRCSFVVRLDPLRLKVLGTNGGNFMQQGNALAEFTESMGTSGQLVLAVEQNGGMGAEGAGSVAAIQVQALAPGLTTIELAQIEVADDYGNPIFVAAPGPYTIVIDATLSGDQDAIASTRNIDAPFRSERSGQWEAASHD